MHRLLSIFTAASLLCACNVVSSIIHDDEVVARVGGEKLYLSEVTKFVPDFIAPEDSAALARQYINSWATQILYLQAAADSLSEEDVDVSAELEDYRRSLLRYRYEQHYIRQHLDTLVTDEQLRAYYESHRDAFVLERPLLRVRFADVMADSPSREAIISVLAQDDCSEVMPTDTVLRWAAIRYSDLSASWTDAMVLAKEFGTDYLTMLGHLKGNYITYEPEGRGDVMIAYVVDIEKYGVAPLESCRDRIRDYILSGRKRDLINGLEQELLEDAVDRKQFVIY